MSAISHVAGKLNIVIGELAELSIVKTVFFLLG